MARATVNGLSIAYEVIGEGRPWAITPGGRFSKDFPGVRELAEGLAAEGNQVLIYDRPNCGASDVCFTGESESAMQADTLAALLEHLDMTPAVIAGGSGGARVSMLTAARHPEVAAGLAVWWISGGAFGLMSLGMHYCGQNLLRAWQDGMDAVAALPEWEEVISRNPSNRQLILDQDRAEFVQAMERWMLAYCPCGGELVPGLTTAAAAAIGIPALVFRSGESDAHHTRATSEEVARMLPNSRLAEPPWGDREWIDRSADHQVNGKLFDRWPLLAPQLTEWSRRAFS
jgi:pimeloyl-ACP methyl ester carboxylesterase